MNGSTLWYQSKTLWGSIIAMLAGIATMAGLNLDATLQDQLAELVVGLANLIGGGMAWYGRVTATTAISSNVLTK